MAWRSKIIGEEANIIFGDKPYGNFWEEIGDETAKAAIAAAPKPAPAPVVKSDSAKAAQSALAVIAADVVTPAPLKDLLTKIVSSLP